MQSESTESFNGNKSGPFLYFLVTETEVFKRHLCRDLSVNVQALDGALRGNVISDTLAAGYRPQTSLSSALVC